MASRRWCNEFGTIWRQRTFASCLIRCPGEWPQWSNQRVGRQNTNAHCHTFLISHKNEFLTLKKTNELKAHLFFLFNQQKHHFLSKWIFDLSICFISPFLNGLSYKNGIAPIWKLFSRAFERSYIFYFLKKAKVLNLTFRNASFFLIRVVFFFSF